MTTRPRRGRSLAVRLSGLLAAALPFAAGPAWGWGHTGHVWVGQLAAEALPAEIPDFVRTTLGQHSISEWNAELDVSKTSGTTHDNERDNGHFIDLDDNGSVLGIVPLASIPVTRRDYDTALRAGNQNQYSGGFLWHSLVDGWQQIRKDFAYIRALNVGIATATTGADRAFFMDQLELRKTLTVRDIGVWGHYVADASQPMHVSIHFNGWGNYPNPNNYTQAAIHAPFEGTYLVNNASLAATRSMIPGYRNCGCAIEQRVNQYLLATLAQLEPTYRLAPQTGNFTTPDRTAATFINARLAAGAAEMRDMIIDAWRASATWTVGFPLINVADIEAGRVRLTRTSFWSD